MKQAKHEGISSHDLSMADTSVQGRQKANSKFYNKGSMQGESEKRKGTGHCSVLQCFVPNAYTFAVHIITIFCMNGSSTYNFQVFQTRGTKHAYGKIVDEYPKSILCLK